MESQFEIWINGLRVKTEAAVVSVLDRGFLYGDSVFETLRTYGKQTFALDEHLRRLAKSAEQVFITMPLSFDSLKLQVEQAVADSQFEECYIRVMITRGQAALGLDPVLAKDPTLVMILAQLVSPPRADYESGIRAVTYPTSRLADHTAASGAKLGNYLVAVLGQKKAAEAGAKEALITTNDGYVLEGASSNLFWVKDDCLFTTPLEAGVLAGITRAQILSVARELNISTELRLVQLHELLGTDAVFISSSIREMMPVVQIDEHVIGDGVVSPFVKNLHLEFRATALRSLSCAV